MRRTATLFIVSAVLIATMMSVFVGTPASGQTRPGAVQKTQTHTVLQGNVTTFSSVPLQFVMRVSGTSDVIVVADQDTVLTIGAESGQHTISVSELRLGDWVAVSGTVLVDGRVLADTVKVGARTAQVFKSL
jgi:hypothetical protein